MSRTRSDDYDLIKTAILDQAAMLFASQGFAETPITEISNAAGLSKAGIYHYFESKQQILSTMLTEYLEQVHEIVDSTLSTSDPPKQKLFKLIRLLIGVYTKAESRSKHTVLMNESGSLDPKERQFILSMERRVVRAVERLIETIHPDIKDYPQMRRPLTMLFFGMMNWTDTWYNAKGLLSPDQLAETIGELFLNGLMRIDLEVIAGSSHRLVGRHG